MKGGKGNGHSFVLEKKLCVYNIIESKVLANKWQQFCVA